VPAQPQAAEEAAQSARLGLDLGLRIDELDDAAGQQAEQPRERRPQLTAGHDVVDVAVAEVGLGPAEVLRQGLAVNDIRAFGSATITSPSAANEAITPPVVGWARTET
jgi:hypothetical protein